MEHAQVFNSPIAEKGYWGNTTPEQDEALRQVKENIKDVITEWYDDARLLRFLRARGFQVDATVMMIRADITWRKTNNVEENFRTFPTTDVGKRLLEYWPNSLHMVDKYGLPLSIERITLLDPKSLFTSVAKPILSQVTLYFMERVEHEIIELSKKAGRPLDFGIISIFDVQDLGWKHMYTPALNMIKEVIEIQKDHYPEIIRKLLIVGCPRIFGMFWTIFKPLLDPRTSEKTVIQTDTEYYKYLHEQMDIQFIPTEYGGKKKDLGPKGGSWHSAGANEITVSTEITVKARSIHEVPLKIEKESSTIALEFKVHSNQIRFKILREKGPKEFEEVFKQTEVSSTEPYNNSIEVKQPGTYILVWDNSHSMLTSKKLSYRVEIVSTELEHDLRSNESIS